MKQIDAAIAIVLRPADRKILVCQRKADDTFGGFWEFPGGKQESGETIEACLARELREEIGIVAAPMHRFPTIEHAYPTAHVRLHPFLCRHESGDVQLIECQDARWIDAEALHDYRFPPANESLIRAVIDYLSTPTEAPQRG